MGWLITLSILVLLAILPLGVYTCYNEDGLLIKIIAGPVRWQVVPSGKKKEQKHKDTQKKSEKKKASASKHSKAVPDEVDGSRAGKKGGNIGDFMPLIRLALEFLGAFSGKLRVNRLDLNLMLAGDDPCDLATNYGKAWIALGNLWPKLEEIFVIRKRNVQIQCDFESTMTHVTACLDISITLGRLLCLIVCYGIRALAQYMKITNKGKGGAAV